MEDWTRAGGLEADELGTTVFSFEGKLDGAIGEHLIFPDVLLGTNDTGKVDLLGKLVVTTVGLTLVSIFSITEGL